MNFVAIGSDDDLLPINEILGNKFQWNLNQYTTILIEKKTHLKILSANMDNLS